MSKAALQRDYVVPPLEGLWWSDDMADFVARRKDRWRWTMMIAVPDFVEAAMADEAIVKAREKKQLPALPRLRLKANRDNLTQALAHRAQEPSPCELHPRPCT